MRLGSGGMGEVYRARDPRLGREVAIKALTEGAASDRDRLRVDCEIDRKHPERAVARLKRYLAVPLIGEHGRQQAQWPLAELEKTS